MASAPSLGVRVNVTLTYADAAPREGAAEIEPLVTVPQASDRI